MSEEVQTPNLGNQYQVVHCVGRGYLASVWLVADQAGNRRVAKVFDKSRLAPEIAIYLRHLQQVADTIPLSAASHLSLPRFTGETEDVFYQVFDYLDAAETLDRLIGAQKVTARIAFAVLEQLASALATLHDRNVIHADVKPSNILVEMRVDTPYVHLIDFGMVQSQSDETIFLVGTFAYLHPSLARQARTIDRTDTGPMRVRAKVGSYIDLYAAGVVALEMLTGERGAPAIATQEVTDSLLQRNPELRLRHEIRRAAADLIARMLSVNSSGEALTAVQVASSATALLADFLKTPEPFASTSVPEEPSPILESPLTTLEALAERLARSTAALIVADGTLRLATSPEQEQAMLADIQTTFANALARSRTSWRLSLFFTVIVFIVITAMVTLAVALTVQTGEKQWGVIFGTATVPIVLGLLVWKPFEKLFTAAIQTQQIELIHVRTVSGFRGTSVIEDRMRLCTEAIDDLRTILQPQSRSRAKRPSPGRRSSKGKEDA